MDVVTALPSLARGILDGITRRIGLTIGKGPPFVYLPSWVPTVVLKDVDSRGGLGRRGGGESGGRADEGGDDGRLHDGAKLGR